MLLLANTKPRVNNDDMTHSHHLHIGNILIRSLLIILHTFLAHELVTLTAIYISPGSMFCDHCTLRVGIRFFRLPVVEIEIGSVEPVPVHRLSGRASFFARVPLHSQPACVFHFSKPSVGATIIAHDYIDMHGRNKSFVNINE